MRYKERKEIFENDKIQCLAFTCPLMNFSESDSNSQKSGSDKEIADFKKFVTDSN